MQRCEELKDRLLGTSQLLELIGGNDDRHRVAVARDGLRPFGLREFDDGAER
jgi:hypothetical protein